MSPIARVLDDAPVPSLGAYRDAGGGTGLRVAREGGAAATVAVLEAAGLRGRGGAGFPTAVKWRSVLDNVSPTEPPTVVVNGAEGEPGSFKDRTLLRRNPYRVLEGALVAAETVAADRVVVAVKASFRAEIERLSSAVAEVRAAGWPGDIAIDVVEGPGAYLYGEETALLEVVGGRAPFPRIAPPFRRGDAGVDSVDSADGAAGSTTMASPQGSATPPALVNNVETMANVPGILSEGPDWFRSVGTAESPGTVVCTVTGRTRRHGVAEVAMGTRLDEVIDQIGGGPRTGRVVAVMSGVANPLLPGDRLDTPVSYEHMVAAGAGIGAAGFIVFDQSTDVVAVAHGVARFLAVESCGQCTPCKQDGLAIAAALDRLRRSEPDAGDVELVEDRLSTVADGARCYLATQHQLVVSSVLALFPDAVRLHADGSAPPAEGEPIVPIVDIVEGAAVLDDGQLAKQPDWSFDREDSGQSPADRLDQGEIEAG